jgi:hypothetical protein
MGNIYNDIVEDINIVKPAISKLVLKWVIRIAVSLIGVAFVLGQVKTLTITKRSTMESSLDANTRAITDLRTDMKAGFNQVNSRIDKVYDDGYKAFNDFQQFNNKQLGIIIDYGTKDKDMLKRILELTSLEETKNVQNGIEQAKAKPPQPDSISIVVKQVKPIK